jgi:hypothetical protein
MSPTMRESIKSAVKVQTQQNDAQYIRHRSQGAAYLVLTSPHYDVQR